MRDKETNEEKREVQKRKKYAARGEASQKMVAFRLDVDLLDWLQKQVNRGRYLNNLIRAHRDTIKSRRWAKDVDADEMPSQRDDWQI